MTIRSVSHIAGLLQYPLYRTARALGLYDARMGGKREKSKRAPAWARALEDHVKDSKTVTWAKIAAKMDMTEGGIRHWRNGTREIKLTEYLALCRAAGVQPAALLSGDATEAAGSQLSAREEMMLDLFRGLTPEQQRELVIETIAAVDANRKIREFVKGDLHTFSNEDVEAAFGKIPPLQPRVRRTKTKAGKAKRDPSTPLDDYPDQ